MVYRYTEKVIEHFKDPHNTGKIEDADAVATEGSLACGDMMTIYIKEKDGIPLQKRPVNKERLIALLRDEYQVESVALLFMINNYFRSDIPLGINTLHNDDVEFAVVLIQYFDDGIGHGMISTEEQVSFVGLQFITQSGEQLFITLDRKVPCITHVVLVKHGKSPFAIDVVG